MSMYNQWMIQRGLNFWGQISKWEQNLTFLHLTCWASMLELAFDFICNAHRFCNLTEVAISALCSCLLWLGLWNHFQGVNGFVLKSFLSKGASERTTTSAAKEKKEKIYFSRENLQSISDDWVMTQIVALPYGCYTNNYFGCKYSKLVCYDRLCCDCVCVSMEI